MSLFFGRIERYYYPRYTHVRRHARKGTRGVRSHSRRISDGVRFVWVPHQKKYKIVSNKKILKQEFSKVSSKTGLKGFFKQQSSSNDIKITSKKNNQDIPSLNKNLSSYKNNILSAIENKTLSREQFFAVWENQNRYDFTVQELKKLELYNAKLKPVEIVYSCRQCWMVGDNCTCDRS